MRSSVSRLYDAVFVIAAVLVALLYVGLAGGDFPLDDSWIHQTYGRNLALTGQWAFVPGTPSAASTSPLYTVVLSAGYKLNIPFRLWTHGIGVLALILTAMLGARLVEMLPNCRRFVPLITGLALIAAWHLIWAAVSGMETMIFGMFTLLLIWLAWRELGERSQAISAVALRGAIFGVATGLATLTRPEGVMLAGLIGLALIIVRPNMSWRNLIIWGGAALICFAVVLAPYLIFNYHLTGGLLPNTAAAKRMESAPVFYRSYLSRIGTLLKPLAAGGQLLLVPGMIAFAALLPRKKDSLLHGLLLIWPVALIMLYAATLPLEFQHGRYVIPALPAAIVAGVVGMGWLLHRTSGSIIGRVLVRTLVGLDGAAVPGVHLWAGAASLRDRCDHHRSGDGDGGQVDQGQHPAGSTAGRARYWGGRLLRLAPDPGYRRVGQPGDCAAGAESRRHLEFDARAQRQVSDGLRQSDSRRRHSRSAFVSGVQYAWHSGAQLRWD